MMCIWYLDNRCSWKHSHNDKFSMVLAYWNKVGSSGTTYTMYNLTWRWPGPERHHCFLWKVKRKTLVTNYVWWAKGLADSYVCQIILKERKSNLHAIRDCIKVVGVWDKVVSQVDMARFFSLYLDNWIGVNLSPSNSVWHILFVVLMNVLWERCNKCIFINEWENDISLINRAKFNVKCIQESLIQDQQTPKGICRCSLTICWRYPPTRWGKLDCDGALSSNSNLANVAKVHRDDNGFFFFCSTYPTIWDLVQLFNLNCKLS